MGIVTCSYITASNLFLYFYNVPYLHPKLFLHPYCTILYIFNRMCLIEASYSIKSHVEKKIFKQRNASLDKLDYLHFIKTPFLRSIYMLFQEFFFFKIKKKQVLHFDFFAITEVIPFCIFISPQSRKCLFKPADSNAKQCTGQHDWYTFIFWIKNQAFL